MDLLDALLLHPADRQPADAVLVFPTGEFDPNGFLRFLSLVRKLPQRILLVTPRVDLVPHVTVAQRVHASEVGPGLRLVDLHFGYDDEQNVPDSIALVPDFDASQLQYYVIDDRVVNISLRGMARWRAVLLRFLSAASAPPTQWFHLPPDRTTSIAMGPSPQHPLEDWNSDLASDRGAFNKTAMQGPSAEASGAHSGKATPRGRAESSEKRPC